MARVRGREFAAVADYLSRYCESGIDVVLALIIGEKGKALHDSDLDSDQCRIFGSQITAAEASGFAELLGDSTDAESLRLQEDVLASGPALDESSARETDSACRRLLCPDVVSFLMGDLLALGIGLIVDYATSKNPVQVLEELRSRESLPIDLVFYRPFTYEFSPAFAAFTHWRKFLLRGEEVRAAADGAWRSVERVLETLTRCFDCSIYVHNASASARDAHDLKRAAKLWLSAPKRRLAKQLVNALPADSVATQNAGTYKHVFVPDEDSLVGSIGE